MEDERRSRVYSSLQRPSGYGGDDTPRASVRSYEEDTGSDFEKKTNYSRYSRNNPRGSSSNGYGRRSSGSSVKKQVSALTAAERILSYADNSEAMLRRKLAQRGYASDEIEYALEELREHGLLNELESCARQWESIARSKRLGPARVRLELRAKGYSPDVISRAEPRDIDYADIALRLAKANPSWTQDKLRSELYKRDLAAFLAAFLKKGCAKNFNTDAR